jgi:acetyl-CoA synthetase
VIEKYLAKTDFSSYEDFFCDYKLKTPHGFNFAYDVMDGLAAKKGGERALVWCDERGAEAVFTYADLKRLSDKTANVLKAAGIGKGDPVMLVLKRRHEFWPAILALHKLGAVAIPATHLLTVKDIVYRCNAADIKAIVAVDDAAVMDRIDDAQAQSPTLKLKAFARSVHAPADARPAEGRPKAHGGAPWLDLNAAVAAAPAAFAKPAGTPGPDDIMLLYFTSGTTGMPKMVRHNFSYPLGHLLTAKYWQQVKAGGLHLTVADTGWAKAAWGKIYGQWLCECAVFVYDYDRFVPKQMLDVVSKHRVTSFCAPPTIYRFFIKEDLKQWDFSALEHCSVAGEPLNPEVYEQFKAATGLKLMEGYGQTELTVVVATFPWLEPKPGSMGKPAPGYDIDIVHEDGASCEVGEEGQIVVRTGLRQPAGMFGGYYRDPTLTAKVWHDNVYYTGDMAWRDEDGYFWFVGRSDDVIKSSGYRIGPFEVESALLEHQAVLECAVTGVPDPDRGMAVKATVVLAKGWTAGDDLKLELQEHVKKTTAPYKYPRVIEFVAELPKTISGKIRRVQIREGDK